MNGVIDLFRGRSLLISSKHGKHQSMAKSLESAFGVNVVHDLEIDTDQFGTFAGDVERRMDAISALKVKCLFGMDLYGFDLGVATEASFGPHPSFLWSNAHEEFIILIDRLNNLEIVEKTTTLETNFNHIVVSEWSELLEFGKKVKFPSHALILKAKDKMGDDHYIKGIQDEDSLRIAFESLMDISLEVHAETDMRAMNNPTRLKVISELCLRLIEKVLSTCPQCAKPGFGDVSFRGGLPCESCGNPTNSVLSKLTKCSDCGFETELLNPNNRFFEEPMFCDFCNP